MLDFLPPLLSYGLAILIGFIGLTWSADHLVEGSAAMAKNLGIAPIVIGLTIVSLGTSAPEIMVAISAALDGAGDLAVGNALGSNIANIGLVLGITLCIATIPLQKKLLKVEMPVLLAVTVLAGIFLADAHLAHWEGAVLLLAIVPVMAILVKTKQGEMLEELDDIPKLPMRSAIIWFLLGLVFLIVSSEILVWGAERAALHFGVSPLLVGLTVVAVGTSLPELAASVTSARRGHHDIALGNIIGSNMFNLLAVMSVPGLLRPPAMEAAVFSRDYGVMLAFTVLLAVCIGIGLRRRTPQLGRAIGLVLLAGYLGYYVLLYTNVMPARMSQPG